MGQSSRELPPEHHFYYRWCGFQQTLDSFEKKITDDLPRDIEGIASDIMWLRWQLIAVNSKWFYQKMGELSLTLSLQRKLWITLIKLQTEVTILHGFLPSIEFYTSSTFQQLHSEFTELMKALEQEVFPNDPY